jgi:hypothetical protein
MRVRPVVAFVLLVTCAAVVPRAFGADVPSGEVQLGQSFIEPAYDDMTGKMIFLLTPLKVPSPSKANSHAVAPLYLIVYPVSAAESVGTMNCMHAGGDNCPDHGPEIAGAAAAIEPGVYGDGVWGHDHLLDAPGGSDFNVAWQVHVMLFSSAAAANTHITTEEEMDAAIDAGDLFEAIPNATVFNCSVVSPKTFTRGTPVPVAPVD